ncbi:hypothetical protein ACOMHN_060733 [Nucella lapillus]
MSGIRGGSWRFISNDDVVIQCEFRIDLFPASEQFRGALPLLLFKMKVVCLLLILSVAAVYHTEAGWWGKAVGFVKTAVGGIARFVGKRQLQRRKLSEDMDTNDLNEMNAMCSKYNLMNLTPDGIPFEIVKIAFEEIDKEGQGVDALNEKEMDEFLKVMDIFEYCMKRGKQV